jgi:hypothetical protein
MSEPKKAKQAKSAGAPAWAWIAMASLIAGIVGLPCSTRPSR